MNLRIFVRAGTILLLLLLSIYFVQQPVHERFDISRHDGEIFPIYFTKIAESSEGGYIVEVGITKERTKVITNAQFITGEVVSFYGTVKNNSLIVQKHHRHKYPDMSYVLSFVGLLVFVWLMKKEGE